MRRHVNRRVRDNREGLRRGRGRPVHGQRDTIVHHREGELIEDKIADGRRATLGGNASSIVNAPSTITLITTGATLVVSEDILFDRRDLIINGLTGLTFNDDPSAWTAPSWNGLDAVSLSLVPEPTAALMATLMAAAVTARLRRP